ncbi:MAG: hypothetical protein KAJ18_04725 [Candidatus Omnitrophica bacterium]|nr:hypothetical protein [Candidatus Omnitrophota bacterium]
MKRIILTIICLTFLFGCDDTTSQQSSSGSSAAPAAVQENPFQPFVVYSNKGSRDNHYVPSGFMPNGKCLSFTDAWLENCHEGRTCMKIEYDVACSREDQKWAGIYWLNPANNWGNQKGGYNLEGATALTFWAKGEKGGERIEEFKMGGIIGDYPDTDMGMIGPVILTDAWRKYSIDLRGKDISYISGGFSWSTSVDVNSETCTFYIDQVQYE